MLRKNKKLFFFLSSPIGKQKRAMGRNRFDAFVSVFVTVHPHESSALLHSFFCFFFILSAYFVVLPLRDEGAISLGLSNLPGLFIGSLLLTVVAAPFSSLVFSLPNLSKNKVLQCITHSVLYFMALLIRWIFNVQFDRVHSFDFERREA